ncbi:MAG: four helix bundle protein [Patescibacteria group bacterium]
MPRTERFGIGSRIDFLFLDNLELLRKAMYAPINSKIVLLEEVSTKVDSVRFFFQLAWEAGLVSHNQFVDLGSSIEELGKIVGGWKKGIVNKTSAPRTEERRE